MLHHRFTLSLSYFPCDRLFQNTPHHNYYPSDGIRNPFPLRLTTQQWKLVHTNICIWCGRLARQRFALVCLAKATSVYSAMAAKACSSWWALRATLIVHFVPTIFVRAKHRHWWRLENWLQVVYCGRRASYKWRGEKRQKKKMESTMCMEYFVLSSRSGRVENVLCITSSVAKWWRVKWLNEILYYLHGKWFLLNMLFGRSYGTCERTIWN